MTDTEYRVYIDEQLISTVPAPEPVGGSFGIGISDGTGSAKFDNLVVRVLEETTPQATATESE